MDAATTTHQLAAVLAPALVRLRQESDPPANGQTTVLELDNKAIDRLVAFDLQRLAERPTINATFVRSGAERRAVLPLQPGQ
jgi:hypothetical protein